MHKSFKIREVIGGEVDTAVTSPLIWGSFLHLRSHQRRELLRDRRDRRVSRVRPPELWLPSEIVSIAVFKIIALRAQLTPCVVRVVIV
jgi:hypothetical protein